MRKFSFSGMMVQVKTVAERNGGHRIIAYIRPGSDEMIERLEHFALFASSADAEDLAKAIGRAREIDLDCWIWSPSQATPFAAFQVAPVAIAETRARPSTRPVIWD